MKSPHNQGTMALQLLLFKRHVLVACAWLVLVSGCATDPIELAGLQPTGPVRSFELREPVTASGGSEATHLALGTYRSVRSGPSGTMYAAPGFGIIRHSSRGFMGYPGGIWIPSDPGLPAKVYVLIGMRERLYPNLEAAVALPAHEERQAQARAAPQAGGGTLLEETRYDQSGWLTVLVIGALVEQQQGKAEFIAEISRAEVERRAQGLRDAHGR